MIMNCISDFFLDIDKYQFINMITISKYFEVLLQQITPPVNYILYQLYQILVDYNTIRHNKRLTFLGNCCTGIQIQNNPKIYLSTSDVEDSNTQDFIVVKQ